MDQAIVEWVNNNRIRSLDPFFIFLTDTASLFAYLIPVIFLLLGFYKKRNDIKFLGLQLLSSILLSTVLVTVIKNMIRRQRPYEIDKIIHKMSYGGGFSFPSGHTADVMVMAISLTLVLNQKRWLLIPVWIWALLVAYSRMMLGVHYATDLLAATFIAFICALLMNFLFTSVRQKSKSV